MFDITVFGCENFNIRNIFCCCKKKPRLKKKQTKTIICKKIEGVVNIERMFSKECIANGITIVFNTLSEIISVSGTSLLFSGEDLRYLVGKSIHELDNYVHMDLLYIIDEILTKTKSDKQTYGVLVKVVDDEVISQYIVATFPVIQNINSIVYSILLIKQPYSASSITTDDIISKI